MRKAITVAVLLASSLAASSQAQELQPAPEAPAAGGESFGDPGQIVIGTDMDLNFIYSSEKPPIGDSVSGKTIVLSPALDFFLSQNFSVGGIVRLAYSSQEEASVTEFSIGPQAGYNVVLADRISLYPRGGLAYRHVSISPGGMAMDYSGWAVNLFAYAPVLFHPVPHFFLGFGPALSIDLTAKVEGEDANKLTQIGLLFDIGGWF